MNIQLTPDQEFLVRQGIEAGRYRNREEAVQDALSRWEEAERARAELIAALDEAEQSIDAGDGTGYDEAGLHELFEDVKRRGREQLAVEGKRPAAGGLPIPCRAAFERSGP